MTRKSFCTNLLIKEETYDGNKRKHKSKNEKCSILFVANIIISNNIGTIFQRSLFVAGTAGIRLSFCETKRKRGGNSIKAKTAGLALLLLLIISMISLVVIAGGMAVAVILEMDNSPAVNATSETANNPIGFEAVFAISGLLAIAYLVLRQRED